MERWRNISGYERLYQVSNHGRIRRDDTKKMLAIVNHVRGYCLVALWKNSKGTLFLVHRLVAIAFIPNKLSLPQVNHKDSNKKNNVVDNLEWSTAQNNILHAIRSGTFKKAKLNG